MYTELIQRCKIMYLSESDGDEDGYFQLPSFLDSIASILIHLDKVVQSHPAGGDAAVEVNHPRLPSMLPSLRCQRCTRRFWSASLWCRLRVSLSTARRCSAPAAGPS